MTLIPVPPTSLPKRQRGAQPGNCNALKHGFYSSQLKSLERQDLAASGEDEVASALRQALEEVAQSLDLATQ